MKYQYFISFSEKNDKGDCLGHRLLVLDEKLTFDNFGEAQEFIKKEDNLLNIVILNFQLLGVIKND